MQIIAMTENQISQNIFRPKCEPTYDIYNAN